MKTEEFHLIITERGFVPEHCDHESLSEEARELAQWFQDDRYLTLYRMGFKEAGGWFAPELVFVHRLSERFLEMLARVPELEIVRADVTCEPDEDTIDELLRVIPFCPGAEYVTPDWIRSVWERLLEIFRKEIEEYDGTVEFYFTERSQKLRIPGRIFFHLVESKETEAPFAFMATYSVREEGRKAKHVPLRYALSQYESDQRKLLELIASIGKAAEKSTLISELMESGELFYPLRLTKEEAWTFLKEIPVYEDAGILCRVPNWWKKKQDVMSVTLKLGEEAPGYVGMEALLSCQPSLMVDGVPITEAELRALLAETEGLAYLKGRWVEVSHEKLRMLLDVYEKAMASDGGMTLAEAMRLEMQQESETGDPEEKIVQVTNGQWLREFRDSLRHPEKLEQEVLTPRFKNVLRPYQRQGLTWLTYMYKSGFGACLADDMGLGKTIQILALAEKLERGGERKVLLVVLASLIGNWQNEIEKFTPDLQYQIMHGRTAPVLRKIFDEEVFLTIVTYGMVTRMEWLAERTWDCIILDEAQAIKNGATKQTRAVKALPGRRKIALTGTPIENHLSDLWSLFDFLNPGLLGSAKEFKAFAKKLTRHPQGYERLRNMVSPFILRRMKTDKTIIQDLPDKVEVKEYIELSKKQKVLYRSFVKELEERLAQAQGIEKKGVVLAALMKFKQICNHPDQYNGLQEYKAGASGKFIRLAELCETIYEKRERVLVFTQFKEMTGPLAEFLTGVFGQPGLVIHGGVPPKKRTELVERFGGEDYVPFMVLSLKAGGVGLNLTAANHVIHFDRWWNPAVENQATDRAFRIGQNKNVMVYKMIAKDTLEERIDRMIEDKSGLSEDIIASGKETWITEMDDRELIQLFRLGR